MTLNHHHIPLATASSSDELAPWCWHLAWVFMIVAALAALIAIIGAVVSRLHSSLRLPRILAIASVLASLFPLCFSAYIHHIDYIAVGGDGTEASGPLWRALVFPFLPVVVSILATVVCHFRSRLALGPAHQ